MSENQHTRAWSEEEQAQLKKLYEQNLTMAEIAALLGRTRSAVLGRIFRTELRFSAARPVSKRNPIKRTPRREDYKQPGLPPIPPPRS